MAGGTVSIQRATTRSTNLDNAAYSLMNGLNVLRCCDKLLDVSLIVEGRTFKAHRAVLAACSDYFCAMFTDAMCEARQSEIKLNGVNACGVNVLIEYAYTGKLDLDLSNVEDVLSVASHVQMNAVIEACSSFLESQIDLENCVAIATLADFYSLNKLRRKAYRFICSRLDEFTRSPDLYSLSLDQLEYILMCNYPVDCSEEHILQITIQYCLHTKMKKNLACRLFAKIRYNQIATYTLNAVLEEYAGNDNIIYKSLKSELTNLKQYNALCTGDSSTEEIISTNVLTNCRGMELALIKIGGFETNGLTNQISCYLPSKRKWDLLTTIPHIEQCNYGSAVLGNELYVVGGSYDVCLKEYIHPFGFRYCPTKNTWMTIAPIQADRCRFSLNAMDGNYLYAVGGVCELNEQEGSVDHWPYDSTISNCERYNVKADCWEYMPALAENRSQHAGVVLADKIFISGGIDRHIVLDSLWCFDTKSEQWQKLHSMPTPRADHVLIAFDDRIYACGGWYEDPITELRVLVDTIDVYEIATNQWSTEAHNPIPKYYTGVAAVKRKIYFVGGLLSNTTINRATSAVQCYDLDSKEWSLNSELEYPKEVWECSCAAFYVPQERDEFKCCWDEA